MAIKSHFCFREILAKIVRKDYNYIVNRKTNMKLKAYLWLMRLIFLVCLAGEIAVIYYIDPEKYGLAGKGIFFAVSLLFLFSFFNLLLMQMRKRYFSDDLAQITKKLSMRQAFLLAILFIIILILQSFRMLVWWDGLLVVAGIFLVELFFLSKK
jgi:hypothetical protein